MAHAAPKRPLLPCPHCEGGEMVEISNLPDPRTVHLRGKRVHRICRSCAFETTETELPGVRMRVSRAIFAPADG